MNPPDSGVEVRPFTAGDEAEVLRLLGASLGWIPDDVNAQFFAWKHRENPFGVSPAWVATLDEQVVGFRTFLRWEFEHDGVRRRAVRAVDTATHPDHQGRGIFRHLTEHALTAMRDDNVAFVFNTPNEQSRPGYLRMGWCTVGRLPVHVRPASIEALGRLVRARVPAAKWSISSNAGVPIGEALADTRAIDALLASTARTGIRTHRTSAYLAWRYGFAPLSYRALIGARGPEDGLLVFRLRRRGPAVEAAVCEELVPAGEGAFTASLLAELRRSSGADYAVRLGNPSPRAGFLPLPRQGPVLLWRDVSIEGPPELGTWQVTLGDVELF